MAPTATKTMVTRSPKRDDAQSEVAQQFKTTKDFSAYIVARVQQAEGSPVPTRTIEVSNVEETEEESQPRKEKRIKGRRRADHPQVHIEAALRRQSELKSGWRSMARPLKQILNEIGRRTVDKLESDPAAHEQASEYDVVSNGLSKAYAQRVAFLRKANEYQQAQLEARHSAEVARYQHHYEQTVREAQDRMFDNAEYRMLQIDRRTQGRNEAADDHDTEDEDDVFLQPHQMSYRYERGPAIDSRHSSRSHFALELERAQHRLSERAGMRDLLHNENALMNDDNFAIMDELPRSSALLCRQGVDGMNMLVHASTQVESEEGRSHKRRKQMPMLANRDATSLMDLAEVAAKRSAQRAFSEMPPPVTPLRHLSSSVNMHDDNDGNAPGIMSSPQLTTGRKRRRSSQPVDISPFLPRPYPELATLQDSMAVKNEPTFSPSVRTPVETRISASLTAQSEPSVGERPTPTPRHNNFDRIQSPPPQDTNRTSFGGFDKTSVGMSQGMQAGEQVRKNGPPTDASPQRPVQPLASPFAQAAIPSYPPPVAPYSFDPEYGRSLLRHPPVRPTAQPINHFANGNFHRHSFASPPAFPNWSPLVALPQPPPPPSSNMPYFSNPWQFGDQFGQHGFVPPLAQMQPTSRSRPLPLPPMPQQQQPLPTPNQYGGPMLAPAGASRGTTQQPAFAQQLGRQEQSRRRNTESTFPKFKVYHGPNQKG